MKPTNRLVNPLLTDLYQLTMAYAYWQSNRHNDEAVFELFFRKNPFKGEYTIYCGLDEVLKHVASFKFTDSDIAYIKSIPAFANCDPRFFDEYLAKLDCSKLKIYSLDQGRTVFPRIPILIVIAPLGLGQLLETTFLTLINYPSLVATNAARMVVAARCNNQGHVDAPLFGLRSSLRSSWKASADFKSDEDAPTITLAEFGLRRAQGPDGGKVEKRS
jgi:nicotinate phosphoribosyltransferase